ncbi:MAG TPA: VOC family protein [Bryobacteraceae bacterium]|nr:VOC family protein [Bryobacteraceae bacterium]
MDIEALHHVSIPVTHLDRSKEFYREILGLREIPRPNFPFQGAWFQVAGRQELHLILEHTDVTYRLNKGIDPGDLHFAVRVKSFQKTVEFLHSKGYREDAPASDLMQLRVLPHPITGYPQAYILDPDRHLIEINADALD